MMNENAAAMIAPSGNVRNGSTPRSDRRTVVYAPIPRKTEYPSETWPAKPPSRFQADARMTANARFQRSFNAPRSRNRGAVSTKITEAAQMNDLFVFIE